MVLWLAPTLRRTLVTNWRNGNFLIGAGALGDGTKAAIMLPLVASEDPVGVNEFGGMAKRAGFLLIDAEGDQALVADDLQLAPGDHPPVLCATFDPSSGKRAELAQKARIALLKPLSPEMLEHPAVLQLHAAKAPRRAV